MKKVLLINSNTEILPYPVAPLGISLIAASIKPAYNVKVYDAAFGAPDELIHVLNAFSPDYVGVGLRNIDNVTMRKSNWYLSDIRDKIIKPIKENTCVPIIIGGSGFSIAPLEVFRFFDVDYGIYGEGEGLFPELLKRLDKNQSKINLDGVISKHDISVKGRTYQKGNLIIPRADIDSFINFDLYKQRGNYPIQTKRGCTHKCIYCSYPKIEGVKYRLRPVYDIVDEIEEVHNRIPDTSFEFVDSTFNSPLKHAINICKEIIKRNLKLRLRTMGVNPGEVTEELIILMKQAGFSQIDCTPDSAAKKMIKVYKKNFSKNKLIQCAEIIRKQNMPTMWFFMIGAPGETEETILETFDFIDKHIFEEDMVHITEGIRIIPETELYQIALTDQVITKQQSTIEPMYYVDPKLGRDKLNEILEREIAKRPNVMNSINTAPSKELMQAAIRYRQQNQVEEPMFRTLLRVEKILQE
jgi:radical SAM superfamily enzyme YgiQ (UPF0313 family)